MESRFSEKPPELRPKHCLWFRRVAAGGHSPEHRRESPHDERRLVVFAYQAMR